MTDVNGNGVKIARGTYISVAVVAMLIGAVVYIVSGMTRIGSQVESQAAAIGRIDDNLVPRNEIDVRLQNIEGSVMRIERSLEKLVK